MLNEKRAYIFPQFSKEVFSQIILEIKLLNHSIIYVKKWRFASEIKSPNDKLKISEP